MKAFRRSSRVSPILFEGLRILDYTAGGGGRSSLAVVSVPPGSSHRTARSRRSEKLYYVVRGAVRFSVAGESGTLRTGDSCAIPVGTWFSYRNLTRRGAKLVLVHTPPFRLQDEEFRK